MEQVWAERAMFRRRLVSLAAALASLIVAISSLLFGVFGLSGFKFDRDKNRVTSNEVLSLGLTNLTIDFARLSGELAQMRSALASATNPPPDYKLLAAITDTASQVSNVSARIKSLEDAITASPDKALAIPMIRKDVDFLQKSQVDDRAAIKAELERLYDFNKWFFGLIATMALTVLGLALTNAFKKPKDAEPEA